MKTLMLSISMLILALFLTSECAVGQSPITDQKKTVAFLFGTVHPVNPDKTPKLDANGRPVVLYMALGTGFFVSYDDHRLGPDKAFFYVATAKHVLRDADGSFLRSVDIRVNLRTPADDSLITSIKDFPVSDAQGNLLWYHDQVESDEAVAANCLPDTKLVDFKVIPISMFVDEATLKSSDVEEGDSLYFIGLFAQFYGSKKNYPVVRRGTLAMMTDEEVPTLAGPQKLFIAELQSWPGNSGSPVFLSLGGLRHGNLMLGENLRFLGILLGEFNNVISATVVGGPSLLLGSPDAANVGVSVIVPATNLKAVLDSHEAQAYRDKIVQATANTAPKVP